MIEIKHKWTGEVIHRDNAAETLRDAVARAVANRANLDGANLVRANLVRANLVRANLYGANLVRANLYGANLVRANLYGANLDGANLDEANLDGANLDGANLYGANLVRANLVRAALPSPTAVLLATWGDLSQQLCADLMLFDSQNHPEPEAFDRWVKGGDCPYGDVKVGRAANFNQKREYWGQGQVCRPYDLMIRVLAERCPDWTDEQRSEFEKLFEKKA